MFSFTFIDATKDMLQGHHLTHHHRWSSTSILLLYSSGGLRPEKEPSTAHRYSINSGHVLDDMVVVGVVVVIRGMRGCVQRRTKEHI